MEKLLALLVLLAMNSSVGNNAFAAEPAGVTRQVSALELGGNHTYVELPDDFLHEQTEGTVEAWVCWDRLRDLNGNPLFNFGENCALPVVVCRTTVFRLARMSRQCGKVST
jgi:hypothetical protein